MAYEVSPKVKARQAVERKICMAVVDALLAAGYSLGVNDGEEVTLEFSKDRSAVRAALFSTDEDYLYVYEAERDPKEKDKRPDMWVRFVYGNSGWDVVCDYSSILDKYLGDGTPVQAMIDRESERS